MKIFSVIFLLIIVTNSLFSQTVKELEYELSYYKSGEEWGNKKEQAYKLLDLDGLNEDAISYLIEVYGRKKQKDSINALVSKVIGNNINNPNVYLIIAEERNAHFSGLSYSQRIDYLKKAKTLDNKNQDAIYMLGGLYYKLFTRENNKKNKKKANLDQYANNAIECFYELCGLNPKYKETMKFPLLQLENYKGNKSKIVQLENYKVQSSYFPISSFLSLPKDWRTNYSINVLDYVSGKDFDFYGVESAVSTIKWYSKHLFAFDEPVLSDSLPTKIYRFTYLRTFHNPIVIRLENNNDTVMIYWKVSDGQGGYEPGNVIENKTKVLRIEDWEKIEKKINSIKYWDLASVKKSMGFDGSQWILEGKKLGKYHVVDRWCGGEISTICKELIELTGMKIDDLY